MAKIVLIGAGSHGFSKNLITDIISYPELRDSTITLMDIAEGPLELIAAFAKKLVAQQGFKTKIDSTTNRREALAGANYVFTTIRVGGQQAYQADQAVTSKYELNTGTSIGPIGVFLGTRQVPVILEICREMEELCPDAWLIDYSNPMAIITWAIHDYTKIKSIGLCHSVQGTAATLAKYIGAPFEEVSYWVAGINHMSWFLEFKWRGEDAYPLLREKFKDPKVYSSTDAQWDGPDIVRAEVFKNFGYYVTEASTIFAEFVPYFRKRNRPELFDKYKIRGVDSKATIQSQSQRDEELRQQINGDYKFPTKRSGEYAIRIINAIETGEALRINSNVMNRGLITNLPEGCCVEVPCLVDKEGIHPCYVGDLPPQLAALNRTNINVQELAVRGIVEKDKTKIFHALLVDPLTSSMLTIDEIRQMVDEMFKAGAEYLKGYK
jgi:alpha-galactosidase